MQIVGSQHEGLWLPHRLRRRRRVILLGLLALIYSGLMVLVGAVLHKDGFFYETIMPYVRGSWAWPVHRLKGLLAEPERLNIHMKWDAYQRLAYQRHQALEQGVLLSGNADFVRATVNRGEKPIKVSIRLKGDSTAELYGARWSFRVKVRGDSTISGMKQFSLHHPRARNWMFEWLAHRAVRREGIIALRYDFVDVVLNGRDLGIYAIEEHFEKRLIESNARREGPIVRFSEDLLWREMAHQRRPFPAARSSGAGAYLASEPDGFQTNETLGNELLRQQYLKAIQLLELFRRGELETSQAFDTKLLATYFALVDLFGAEHGTRWHNMRFYYNPITSRLEPIAFDLNAGQPILAVLGSDWVRLDAGGRFVGHHDQFYRSLFQDMEFYARYVSELERLSEPTYLDTLLAEVQADFDEALAKLYTEYPYYEFSPQVLYDNQRYIRTVLNPVKGLHAYLDGLERGRLVLQVGNIQFLPIAVIGAEDAEGRAVETPAPLVLRPRPYGDPVDFREVTIPIPAEIQFADKTPVRLSALYRVLGTNGLRRAPVAAYDYRMADFERNDLIRRPANIGKFEFVEVDDETRVIRIKPGRWQAREDVIIPTGFSVECGPGTVLDLVHSALVLSSSPLSFVGAAEAPIVVRSSDGTGQGLVVLQAGAPSSLRHVHFDGLTNPDRNGWVLTGAVTFYESPVLLSECRVTGNTCEDGLNLVRSEFRIDRCLFESAMFDAFDADFCQGTITDSTFRRCGNDGIDVSGSVVELTHVIVENSVDKAISAGEASHMTVSDLTIRQARIGLACKDLSELLAHDVSLTGCRYGLAAFQKKSEFGPAVLHVNKLSAGGIRPPNLIEEGSVVSIDGQVVPPNSTDVKDLLYPARDALTERH